MIERYSITASNEQLAERFSIDVPDYYKPHYNAAPTQLLPIITNDNPEGLSNFYWGTTPEWSKNKTPSEKVINLRAETIMEKPALKRAMMNMRCIIPADGFFSWKKIGKKTMIPHRFVLQKQSLFSIAGIWEEFEDENGTLTHTFMMLTTAPNELVSIVDDRMPLILDKRNESVWLKKDSPESELASLLTPYPGTEMNFYTVSPRISDLTFDAPSLINPTPPADQFGNLTLFD